MPTKLVERNYVIETPLYDILKNIQPTLINGKLKTIEVKGEEIKVTCPFHKGGAESHPSCGIYIGESKGNLHYGDFHCFTCGNSGSFSNFVGACFDMDESFGKAYLIKNYGKKVEDLIANDLFNLPIDLKTNIYPAQAGVSMLNESKLAEFQSWHPYLAKRHLSQDVCNKFKVKYDPKSKCIIFPVWDEKNNLVMLTKRSVEDKTFYIEAEKEKPIYLLNNIIKNNIKEVVLCESQINALTLWGWRIPAIATFGCNVTSKQIEILNKSCIEHYILALDGDNAGYKGTNSLIKRLKKSVFVDVKCIPKGKDVNDLTKDEYLSLPLVEGNAWSVAFSQGILYN